MTDERRQDFRHTARQSETVSVPSPVLLFLEAMRVRADHRLNPAMLRRCVCTESYCWQHSLRRSLDPADGEYRLQGVGFRGSARVYGIRSRRRFFTCDD